jgi:beta-N-acetylhexosaminidase
VTPERRLSRRAVLQAFGLASAAVAIGACTPATSPTPSPARTFPPSPTPSRVAGSPAASVPTEAPSASPSAEPSLRERIASLLVVGFRGATVDAATAVRDAIPRGLGGVILFDRDQATGGERNVRSPEQVAALVQGLRSLAPNRRLIVAADQEGGRVLRFSPSHGFPAAASEADVGATGSDAAVRDWAAGLADTLASVGVDLNFAPVVDLDVNPSNPAIGALGRSFSADSSVVAHDAAIEIQAHRTRRSSSRTGR